MAHTSTDSYSPQPKRKQHKADWAEALFRDMFLNYHMMWAENMKLTVKQQEVLKG